MRFLISSHFLFFLLFIWFSFFSSSCLYASPNGLGNEVFVGNIGIGTTVFTSPGLFMMNRNVGIGTWKPIEVLAVNGDLNVANDVLSGGLNVNNYTISLSAKTSAGVDVATIAGRSRAVDINPTVQGDTWALLVTSTSNVGMGTYTVKSKLMVAGAVGIGTFDTQYLAVSPPTSGMIVQGNVGIGTFGPVNGQLIVATTNGNVGIGSFDPGVPLDILADDDTTAQRNIINAPSGSVTGADTFIDFDSNQGSIGSIAGTGASGVIAYNTFTGSHWTEVIDREHLFMLALLCSTGKKVSWGQDQLTQTQVCNKEKDDTVIGAYGGLDKNNRDLVLAIGTGYVIVANKGEDLRIGDYVTTSDILGLAQKQQSDENNQAVVAKVMENIIWNPQEKSRKVAVIYQGG